MLPKETHNIIAGIGIDSQLQTANGMAKGSQHICMYVGELLGHGICWNCETWKQNRTASQSARHAQKKRKHTYSRFRYIPFRTRGVWLEGDEKQTLEDVHSITVMMFERMFLFRFYTFSLSVFRFSFYSFFFPFPSAKWNFTINI